MTEDLRQDPILKDVPEAGNFKVLEPCVLYAKVGQGGMGAVYRGRHLKLDIDVGVKCLLAPQGPGGEELVLRFAREAKLAAMVSHQNLVRVFEVDKKYGVHYLVMEFVKGESARERVRRKGPLRLNEALTILLGATRGVAAAHSKGIVHRDIKPDNIMISGEGEVKLADLGLGRMEEEAEGALDSDQNLTHPDMLIGTPRYMPPEQWLGLNQVGTEGDVWALGATLYFLLAGKDAYAGSARTEILRRVHMEPFPDISTALPELPADIATLMRKSTETDPAKRFPDARALLVELEALASHHAVVGSLRDPQAGSLPNQKSLVSPPPRELLAKLKLDLDSGRLGTPPPSSRSALVAAAKTSAPGEPSTATMDESSRTRTVHETPPARRAGSGKSPWLYAAAALLLVGVAAAVVLLTRPPADDSKTPPPSVPLAKAPAPVAPDRPQTPDELARLGLDRVKDPTTLDAGISDLEKAVALQPERQDWRLSLIQSLRSGARAQLATGSAAKAVVAARKAQSLAQGTSEEALAGTLVVEAEAKLREKLATGIVIEKPQGAGDDPSRALVQGENTISLAGVMDHVESRVTSMRVNAVEVPIPGGRFDWRLDNLVEGPNTILLAATDENGITAERRIVVTVDSLPPELTLEAPLEGAWVRSPVRASGKAVDANLLSVLASDKKVNVVDGAWSVDLTLADGAQALTVVARDVLERETRQSREVFVDTVAPKLMVVDPPADRRLVAIKAVELKVTATDAGGIAEVRVDGTVATRADDGSYNATVELTREGESTIKVIAVDRAGNSVEETVALVRDTMPPVLSFEGILQAMDLSPGKVSVRGGVRDALAVARVTVNGVEAAIDANGAWHAEIVVNAATQEIRIELEDSVGNVGTPLVTPVAIKEYLRIPGLRHLGKNPQGFEEYEHTSTGIVLVMLPGGRFNMGSGDSEPGTKPDERPLHEVELSAFLIAKYEVSQAEWEKAMRQNPAELKGARFPVENVSFEDCMAFCRQTGLELPTEAQWEYACRAGTTTLFAFGSKLERTNANFKASPLARPGIEVTTQAVDAFAPNAFGLHNFHGNVRELCADRYEANFYHKAAARALNPKCTAVLAGDRVMRGGGYGSPPENCRSAKRDSIEPTQRFSDVGFRVALALPTTK